jgi:Ferredoxin-like domain in Api92-like protein
MPNWCNNYLVIEGNPKELNKLMKKVEVTQSEATDNTNAQVFSCQKVIPRPESENASWYEWNIANWGSKWDLSDPVRIDSDWENGLLRYSFDSAWSPITPVIQALAKEHKKLSFTYQYWEGGSDFWGEHEYKNGKEVSEIGGSINDAGCEKLEELMGQHHQCHNCWEAIECVKEDTPDLCDECMHTSELQEKELWEEMEGAK